MPTTVMIFAHVRALAVGLQLVAGQALVLPAQSVPPHQSLSSRNLTGVTSLRLDVVADCANHPTGPPDGDCPDVLAREVRGMLRRSGLTVTTSPRAPVLRVDASYGRTSCTWVQQAPPHHRFPVAGVWATVTLRGVAGDSVGFSFRYPKNPCRTDPLEDIAAARVLLELAVRGVRYQPAIVALMGFEELFMREEEMMEDLVRLGEGAVPTLWRLAQSGDFPRADLAARTLAALGTDSSTALALQYISRRAPVPHVASSLCDGLGDAKTRLSPRAVDVVRRIDALVSGRHQASLEVSCASGLASVLR